MFTRIIWDQIGGLEILVENAGIMHGFKAFNN